MKKTSVLGKIYVGLIVAFLQLPILCLIVYSFNESKSRAVWQGFSLKWYQALFQDSEMITSLGTTLLCAFLAAIISTIIATVAAIGMNSMRRFTSTSIMTVAYIPMLNADIVTGVSLLILFTMLKMELGFATLLLSHITFCIPYVLFSVMPKIRQFDYSKFEAALDLGATPGLAMRKIMIPDIMPGIVSGFFMALTLSIDDFIVSFFTTGNGVQNLSIKIYTMAKRGISPTINALSTIMYLVILAILLYTNLRSMNQDKQKNRKGTN